MFKTLILEAMTDPLNPDHINPDSLNSNLVSLISELMEDLSDTKRKGFLVRGIPESLCENDFEHSKKVRRAASIYSLCRGYDCNRIYFLADIHELGEAIIGDIIPGEMSKDDKLDLEYRAIVEIASYFPRPDYIIDGWLDFSYQRTKEGELVFHLDKLDASIMALSYRNNFRKIACYYLNYPQEAEQLERLYGMGSLSDNLGFLKARLDEFHPYNHSVVKDEGLLKRLDKMIEFKGSNVYELYFNLLPINDEVRGFMQRIARERRQDEPDLNGMRDWLNSKLYFA